MNVEITLRYDHTYDKMVEEHFKQITQSLNVDVRSIKDKSKLMPDRFLSGEIDIETLKRSLELLNGRQKDFE